MRDFTFKSADDARTTKDGALFLLRARRISEAECSRICEAADAFRGSQLRSFELDPAGDPSVPKVEKSTSANIRAESLPRGGDAGGPHVPPDTSFDAPRSPKRPRSRANPG
jgi:hypothetical protein